MLALWVPPLSYGPSWAFTLSDKPCVMLSWELSYLKLEEITHTFMKFWVLYQAFLQYGDMYLCLFQLPMQLWVEQLLCTYWSHSHCSATMAQLPKWHWFLLVGGNLLQSMPLKVYLNNLQ